MAVARATCSLKCEFRHPASSPSGSGSCYRSSTDTQKSRTSRSIALSIFKFDRMEWAIEKCTELGVEQIIPVIAARTEAHLIVAAVKRTERWQRIARQAAEQSRRSSPPQIFEPMRLKNAVSLPASKRIVLAESEQQVMLKDVLQSDDASDDLILALGPEGGWAEEELELFRDQGWISASLGTSILRAETAAIAAVAVVISELT